MSLLDKPLDRVTESGCSFGSMGDSPQVGRVVQLINGSEKIAMPINPEIAINKIDGLRKEAEAEALVRERDEALAGVGKLRSYLKLCAIKHEVMRGYYCIACKWSYSEYPEDVAHADDCELARVLKETE